MPLVAPFRTARSTTITKEALLVRVQTDDGAVGWGECAAQADPSYAPDTIDTARVVLRDHLLPRAFAGVPFDDVRGHLAARAALECALLDARLRAEEVSLAAHLGATRELVDAGVAVGFGETAPAGYRRVKYKIKPGCDAVECAAGVERAVDANGSYTPAQSDALVALDALGLQLVEQPFAPDALLAHADLARRLRTPVALDETITSANVARDAIALRACDAVVVKPGRLGLTEARAVHDVCVEAGVPAVIGGLLETGIGRAALLAVAALPGFTLTGDCAASDRYFGPDGDLTEPFVLDAKGQLRVPDGPGLGVEPIPAQLERFTIAREVVR